MSAVRKSGERTSWIDAWREREFLVLVIVLSAFLFLPAFVTGEIAKDILIYVLLTGVFLAGLVELSVSRRSLVAGVILVLMSFSFNLINWPADSDLIFLLRMFSLMAFFGLLTGHVLWRMIRSAEVNVNIIFSAVSGYLLLGLIGGLAFRLIHHFYAGSFLMDHGLESRVDDFTYFSFITLSNVGYGDITPVSPPGQALAIFLSIAGQMYTAVVIGIIIGKFTFQVAKSQT